MLQPRPERTAAAGGAVDQGRPRERSGVELVGVPLQDLLRIDAARFDICDKIFAHSTYYCPGKLFHDAPEFRPCISLEEGMRRVFDVMDRERRAPDSDLETWGDKIIAAQRAVAQVKL